MNGRITKTLRTTVAGALATSTIALVGVLGASPAHAGVWVRQGDYPNIFACSDKGKFDVQRGAASRYDCRHNPSYNGFELWEFIN